ncbi:TetR/AcrR family transcriptional regulator [Shimwellia pseudoproteus]|uniref:TetR/AcrR family transcriptional regulator n=1 Tax=Shimwellia pseudoproteus TaxID=570012 RepID=UPI0018EA6365|nr:TetR/AcrR family transcriptional regulator [Shimwellia pseudoproteus]MBJ3815835.1 TetR/AcrR family transcriptional regulator [Shimwellia pseudoproteus]
MSAQNSQNPEKSRRPGRPKGAVASAETRERLIDTALEIFSHQDVAETSLNAIAKAAGVTPAMLHYYFHSREQLLDEIVEQRFMPLRRQLADIFINHPDDPHSALHQMVKTLAHLADKHPWFPRLWLQNIEGGAQLLRQHMCARVGDVTQSPAMLAVRRWQQEGKVNPALVPELIMPTLLSLILIPLTRISQAPRGSAFPALTQDQVVDHALSLLDSGMFAQPPSRSTP